MLIKFKENFKDIFKKFIVMKGFVRRVNYVCKLLLGGKLN